MQPSFATRTTPVGSVVGTLATDAGQGINYTLDDDASGRFGLVNGTQIVQEQPFYVGHNLDSYFQIQVSSIDMFGYTLTQAINITTIAEVLSVSNVTLSSSITVSENQPAGTVVATLTANVTGTDATPTYWLLSVTPSIACLTPPAGSGTTDAFQVVGNTLQTTVPFDYETFPTSFTVTVLASMYFGNATATFTVSVTDVPANPSLNTSLGPVTTLALNQSDMHSVVLTLESHSNDVVTNGGFHLALTSGPSYLTLLPQSCASPAIAVMDCIANVQYSTATPDYVNGQSTQAVFTVYDSVSAVAVQTIPSGLHLLWKL